MEKTEAREAINAARRAYYAANKAKAREQRHAYYTANRDKILEYNRKWRAANPDKLIAYYQRQAAKALMEGGAE